MALFSKPPAKKPDVAKPAAKAGGGPARPPPSARDVAVQAAGRRGMPDRPRAEPSADISLAGASLIEWSPVRTSIEVAQSNPGLCAVLENAALLFASGQVQPARTLLEDGVDSDADAKASPLAWLALFDLLQRTNDRAGFDRLSLQYVVQFERSPPAWEDDSANTPHTPEPKFVAGYAALTGKLTDASKSQIESLRKTMAKSPAHSRLDLSQVAGFDDDGARLLADALLAKARGFSRSSSCSSSRSRKHSTTARSSMRWRSSNRRRRGIRRRSRSWTRRRASTRQQRRTMRTSPRSIPAPSPSSGSAC
jgi:hypothetical protein